MAEMEWSHGIAAAPPQSVPAWLHRLRARYFDWEDWLTMALLLGAITSVSMALEAGGWSESMPALTLVSALAAIAALLLARTRLTVLLVGPASVVIGAGVVFWQALEMVGPGTLEQRLDALHFRLDAWLQAALHDGVSNDSLPFHVLILGITWLGVFLFSWSVYRWHNAWIGLVPGGIALFMDLAFVGDSLSGAALLYYLFGFLLIMRTNLVSRMAKWRAQDTPYPQLISFTLLNFSFWGLLVLIITAWIAPVGPFTTPGFVQSAAIRVQDMGIDFVRLAGPLRSQKIVPVHNYTGVLPFQGSVRLGDREIMSVEVGNKDVQGPFALRGTVYESYESGGWQAGGRTDAQLTPDVREHLYDRLDTGEVDGDVIPLTIEMKTQTVAGTVFFSVGQPLNSDPTVKASVPEGSVDKVALSLPDGGLDMSDQEIFRDSLPGYLTGTRVQRDEDGRVQYAEVYDTRDQPLPDTILLQPDHRLKEGTSYEVTGFVRTATPDELRATDRDYPAWVRREYARLPRELPYRVAGLAYDVTVQYLDAQDTLPTRRTASGEIPDLASAPAYDIARAIEDYLRQLPVDYDIKGAPPGQDTVDHFLFESQRGYFDYHASAMVVMLRALDIPARLAVGYVIDEQDYDADKHSYVVRDRNAYAWPEVYFPGYGWVMFNPTPDRPADLYPQPSIGGLPEDGSVDLSDFPGLPVGADPLFEFDREPVSVGTGPLTTTGSGGGQSYGAWILAAVAGFAVLLAGSVALGWRRSVIGLPVEQQTWEKMVRLSSLAGRPLEPGQTPAEYANGLQKTFRGLRGVSVIASAYNRSRFGRRDASQEERERIGELWPPIRSELLRAIAGRILRRGRTGPASYLD